MNIRPKAPSDQPWVDRVLTKRWGGRTTVIGGRVFDAGILPALIAGEGKGLATYALDEDGLSAELITLDALTPQCGIGTELIEALARLLRHEGFQDLRVTTTNDNLNALRFYQRRGFRIVAVRSGAVDEARKIKPIIPHTGEYGIPMRDEIELIRALEARG